MILAVPQTRVRLMCMGDLTIMVIAAEFGRRHRLQIVAIKRAPKAEAAR